MNIKKKKGKLYQDLFYFPFYNYKFFLLLYDFFKIFFKTLNFSR